MGKVIDLDAVYAVIEDACEEIEARSRQRIVYCEGCKYMDAGKTIEAKFTGPLCAIHKRKVKGDDYCSWGEKKK